MGAAAEAGVEHLVLMSVHGASPEHPMSLHRAKYAAEQALQASGLRFTIIRATAFLETWVTVIGGTLSDQGHALVFGPGRNPINFVSVRDVAAVVALSVQDPSMSNEIVEIGGPRLRHARGAARRGQRKASADQAHPLSSCCAS